jgi:hypothetical protein
LVLSEEVSDPVGNKRTVNNLGAEKSCLYHFHTWEHEGEVYIVVGRETRKVRRKLHIVRDKNSKD